MAAAIRGDFARLRNMARQIGKIGTAEFEKFMAERFIATAKKQVSDCFRQERDPYGKAWEPLKYRSGRILRDTGRLAASFSGNHRAGGFEFGTSVEYAKHHQYGTKDENEKEIIPRRQMVPEEDTGGVGPIWGKAFNETADRGLEAWMKRGGAK